jgi:polyisoprenoid-binding protein YceI
MEMHDNDQSHIHGESHRGLRFAIMTVLMLLLLVLQGPCMITASAPATPKATPNAKLKASSRFAIDPLKGKFIAHAFAGGLLWFKGHDHYLAARDFSGEVELTPQTVVPASLRLIVKANSLEETSSDFTEPQKQIINKEVREIVLLPEKHPEIVFQSTRVTSKSVAAGEYDVLVVGNLTLLGVTRQETIPLKLHLSDNDLQAVGRFTIDRDDYKVKATSAAHGLIRVKDKVRFEFDIVAHRRGQ